MKSPFEIAYRYLLPSIRRTLALKLWEQGYSERSIAEMLGVSVPAVSRYIRARRGAILDVESLIGDAIDEALAELLEGGDSYKVEVLVHRLSALILSTRKFCPYHKLIDPSVDPAKCNICSTIFASPRRLRNLGSRSE